jgi:CRISPR-associated protein Cas1
MKVAIIDKKDIKLKVENKAIKIDSQTIPLKLTDVLILNHKIELYTSDILKITKEDISIIITSFNNQYTSIINSASAKNSDMKIMQYSALEYRLKIAKYIIKNKILSHKEHLEKHNLELNYNNVVLNIELCNNIDELMGIEGSYARAYFEKFFMLIPKVYHRSRRSKRPPLDPANALMSFLYTMYYNLITVRLLAQGFEPSLGYLHSAFRDHRALSSDLLELFRAEINELVIQMFRNKIITSEDFYKKSGVYLNYDGRKKIWRYFVDLVQILEPKLNSQIANIKKMIYAQD